MKNISFTLPSFAKINLSLKVLGKRQDNFHELWTVFQMVSLNDLITFKTSNELSIKSDNPLIPVDESNLIMKSAKLLSKSFNVKKGANIYLKKRIPFPGGLGGGSSNAAVTLIGLANLWSLDISFDELCSIGGEIGSDVPFFFYGGTAIGTGRGRELESIKEFNEKYLLIITPSIEISTAEAYSKLNADDLTKVDTKSILKICRDEAKKLESGHLNFTNDFEDSVFEIEPEIRHIKQKLLGLEAKEALLSGSGASVFAIFDNEEKQQIALSKLKDDNSLRTFAVKTISRNKYRDYLESCKYLLPKSL